MLELSCLPLQEPKHKHGDNQHHEGDGHGGISYGW